MWSKGVKTITASWKMYSVCTERLEGTRSFSRKGRCLKDSDIVERDSWNSPVASKWEISFPPQTAVLRQFFYDTFQPPRPLSPPPPTPHLDWKDPAVHYVFFIYCTCKRDSVSVICKTKKGDRQRAQSLRSVTHIFKKKEKKNQQTLAHVMYLSSPSAVILIAM